MSVPRITREELKARLDSADTSSHPLIIDVRLKYPYEHSTVMLPGSQRVLPDAIASAALPRDRDIVVYDSDPDETVASQAAAELLRRGHRAFVLQGGVAEWMNAKFPVATKSAPQPAAPAAKAAPAPAAKPAAASAAPKPAAAAPKAVPASTPTGAATPASTAASTPGEGPAPSAGSAPDKEGSSGS
jgi:rhodanese-related sulfurtransferase